VCRIFQGKGEGKCPWEEAEPTEDRKVAEEPN